MCFDQDMLIFNYVGYWLDHSSQVSVNLRTGGLRASPLQFVDNSFVVYSDPQSPIWLMPPKKPRVSDMHGLILVDVHVMMFPWSSGRRDKLNRTKFKIIGLHSC